MSRRVVPLLVAVLLATSACRMQRSSRNVVLGASGALAVGGLLVARQGPVDSDSNGRNDFILNDNLGAYVLGGALVIGAAALFLGGATAVVTDDEVAGPPPTPPGPIVARVPSALRLVVTESRLTSTVTPFAIDLAGWSVGAPYTVQGRTHVIAVADGTQLQLSMQELTRPVTPSEAVEHMDLSAYGSVGRRGVRIDAVPAIELIGATGTTPVVVVIAIEDLQLLSMVCRGSVDRCRDAMSRATWTSRDDAAAIAGVSASLRR